MSLQAIPLNNFGVEIKGLDPSVPIPEPTQKELYDLWLEHGILLFRNLATSSEEHLRVARCFGPLQKHPVEAIRLKENDELMYLGTEGDTLPVQYVDGEARRGFIYWHSDMSYVPEINKGALLRMIECPTRGGQTMWTDTAAAFDDLPELMKKRISSLSTVQACRNAVTRPWGQPNLSLKVEKELALPTDFPLVLQPMVITHGESGRKSLLLSPLGYVKIDGLPQDEGDALFEELTEHALQEKYRYIHNWGVNDMVLWDNRRTMHCALGYPLDERRLVYRATLAEVQPTGSLYQGDLVA